MNRTEVRLLELEKALMENGENKDEYMLFKYRYQLITKIVQARKELGMTQEALALRMGTKKSNISRLESGNYNPTLDFLHKLAKALGKEIYCDIR